MSNLKYLLHGLGTAIQAEDFQAMNRQTKSRPPLAIILMATAALALAGCHQSQSGAVNNVADAAPPLDALPLTTVDTPSQPAPALTALPAAGRARGGASRPARRQLRLSGPGPTR